MHQAAKTVMDNVIQKGYTPLAVGSAPLLFDTFTKLVHVFCIKSEIATNFVRENLILNMINVCMAKA